MVYFIQKIKRYVFKKLEARAKAKYLNAGLVFGDAVSYLYLGI